MSSREIRAQAACFRKHVEPIPFVHFSVFGAVIFCFSLYSGVHLTYVMELLPKDTGSTCTACMRERKGYPFERTLYLSVALSSHNHHQRHGDEKGNVEEQVEFQVFWASLDYHSARPDLARDRIRPNLTSDRIRGSRRRHTAPTRGRARHGRWYEQTPSTSSNELCEFGGAMELVNRCVQAMCAFQPLQL